MSLYNYAQLVLAAAVVGLAVHRWREFSSAPQLDAEHFVSALLRHQQAGRLDDVTKLLATAGVSWLGRVARAALRLNAEGQPDPESPSLDEVLSDQRYEASRGMLSLRISMTLGSVSGLAGALYEVAHLPAVRHSLLGLVAGLPEQRAFESAMISVGIGVAIALFAGLALSRLRRRTKRLYAESLEAATTLEGAVERAAS